MRPDFLKTGIIIRGIVLGILFLPNLIWADTDIGKAVVKQLNPAFTMGSSRSDTNPTPIPWSELGAQASMQSQGRGTSIQASKSGACLESMFQRLAGEVGEHGLQLWSTVKDDPQTRFSVLATGLGRQKGRIAALERSGRVEVEKDLIRFVRSGLVEEYTVSVDGVRQDLVIAEPPPGNGDLRVELSVVGATARPSDRGATLILQDSRRQLSYHRLRVLDARNRQLPARIVVESPRTLAVVVADADAVYPIRIDPTFSDADWYGMGFDSGPDEQIHAVAVMDGDVYVGGSFTENNHAPGDHIARWDGNHWYPVGVYGANNTVIGLLVDGSDLYLCGSFTVVGEGESANHIAKWSAGNWSALGSGTNDLVNAMAMDGDGNLYVGGSFTTAGGVSASGVAKWNGSAWSALGSGVGDLVIVDSIVMDGSGNLYAGGYFTTAGGVTANRVAKWDGSNWSALGSGVNSGSSEGVYALAIDGVGNLYVGGQFTYAGGVPANNIAIWNGISWTALGSGVNDFVNVLAPSGDRLYVGGNFTQAGGNSAFHMAYADNLNIAPWTYYVTIAGGSDSNDGSADHPWKTLHHAISRINGGGAGTYVLHVALGTYYVSGSTYEVDEEMVLSQSDVTIKGESGSGPIIDGTNAQTWTKGLEITGSNVTIENLYITGFSDTDEEGILISADADNNKIRRCKIYGNDWGIRIDHSDGSLVRDCEIYLNTTHGIDVTWSSNVVVTRNKVYSNPQYGIRAQCSPEISRNLIYDNGCGIRVEAIHDGDDSSPTIKNNVIYETTSGAMSYGIYSLAEHPATVPAEDPFANPEIYHNTIDGGTLSGVVTKKGVNGSSSPIIKYNIITNFSEAGINNILANLTNVAYNDVWNNGDSSADNYKDCTAGTGGISSDPKYASYSLAATSPCKYIIPNNVGDTVTPDYPGFTRPRPGAPDEKKSMGAYEYVADVTNSYTMPGGTGIATDYRIFTVPLNLGTGADMLTAMENVLGTYDPVHWRGFLYMGTAYREFNSSQFASQAIVPGMGFWIITTYTNQIPFQGGPAPDGVDYVMDLEPGWHLIGLPWTDTDTQFSLDNIDVTDGVYTYAITSEDNNLTQQYVWDYTGDVANNGYVKRGAASPLEYNTGYFLNVGSEQSIRLIIPHPNNQGQDAPVKLPPNKTNTNEEDEAPPPPPGSEPIPDIKANGQDGPVTVAAGNSVSVSISLDPGAWSGRNADWWVAAHTPFAPPLDWYTYVHPEGWRYGIHVCVQTPLFELMSTSPYNVLNTVLPSGNYTFYFAVDGNVDGEPDATWLDFVEVLVE